MHVLALVNQKGGCGKTTTAVNLAAALSAAGERVLLVDLDPQAHATLALGCAIEDEPSLVDVLRERVTVRETVQTAPGGIWLLPATAELSEFEEEAARSIAPERALRRALAVSRLAFDFVVLDCPPRTDGVLAANALRAADTAVLVVESGTFALQGALQAMRVLDRINEGLDRPFSTRAVATLFDRRLKIERELLVGMHAQLGTLLFDTAIRTSVRLREAAAAGVPVNVLDPAARACEDFRALAAEVRSHAAATTGSAEHRDRWLAPEPPPQAAPTSPLREVRRTAMRPPARPQV
jgi:chromosome partitioning protein